MVVMVAYTLILLEFTTRYLLDRPLPNGPWHPFACCSRRRRKQTVLASNASDMTQVGGREEMTMVRGSKEEGRARWMLGALGGSTLLIFIR